VDDKGKPKVVRGKASTSHFVYEHEPSAKPYEDGDHKVYNRKDLSKLPKAQQDKIRELKEKYDKIRDKSSKEAHDAAAELCQEKNALKSAVRKVKGDADK
tara:strand:+ start:252 stop:551 length:300 start_codon:yes stop_codon:yes gene_type:complete